MTALLWVAAILVALVVVLGGWLLWDTRRGGQP